jgi:hypothetical protein
MRWIAIGLGALVLFAGVLAAAAIELGWTETFPS